MPLVLSITGTVVLSLFFLLLSCGTNAQNITRILAKNPEFSTFNHYLTVTHLAAEINRRQTITVCAVNNAGMSDLLSKNLSIDDMKNVLSLHVLLDYFAPKKLHQITNGTTLATTIFQATGSSGFVNITDLKGGKIGFGAEKNDGKLDAVFVKSLEEIPYNFSVIQISQILLSTEAEAPTFDPNQVNITALMLELGCNVFGDLLSASGVAKTFKDNIDGGLTVFCPADGVLNDFMPKYKNFTAERKVSLLLYHGVPLYQSMAMLKSNNEVISTLATGGAKKYDFTVQKEGEEVMLKTNMVTANITGTLLDDQPLAVHKIDKVLIAMELFEISPTPAPTPADQAAKENGNGRLVIVVLGVWLLV